LNVIFSKNLKYDDVCISIIKPPSTTVVGLNHTTPHWSLSSEQQGKKKKKGKAIPVQAWTGPEDSRRLRRPDFMQIGT